MDKNKIPKPKETHLNKALDLHVAPSIPTGYTQYTVSCVPLNELQEQLVVFSGLYNGCSGLGPWPTAQLLGFKSYAFASHNAVRFKTPLGLCTKTEALKTNACCGR